MTRSAQDFCLEHSEQLVRTLTVSTGNRADAEDIAQDALVRAWTHWRRLERMDNPAGWLYRTAFNIEIDRARRRSTFRRVLPRLQTDSRIEAPDVPAHLDVRDALQSLPRKQRAAVALRFVADLSVVETAAVLGIAEGTVRAHTSAGARALRKSLKGDVDE